MTGSPVPLWHIEDLDAPVGVRAVTEHHPILADGREVRLSFIKTVPRDAHSSGRRSRTASRSGKTAKPTDLSGSTAFAATTRSCGKRCE
jgi:hypothetical protein